MSTNHRETMRRARSRLEQATRLGERPPCVLVAEDDDDIRQMLVAALERDGYEVLEAKDGGELLDHVGSSLLFGDIFPRPDVIVSDIRMPGFTGLEVLAGLRDASWSTPVVLITAFGSEEAHQEALRLGADAIFDKPFDVDDLRTVVLNVMPRRALERLATREYQ